MFTCNNQLHIYPTHTNKPQLKISMKIIYEIVFFLNIVFVNLMLTQI